MAKLHDYYKDEVVKQLMTQFNYNSVMQVPRVEKITLIGCKVTLRGERMWEFFERLISIAVPRIRDFRGLSAKSFDGRGNYSMGVREQIIFPEIDYDKVDRVRGLDITITTTAKSDDEGRALLSAFNFPFRK